jgi:polyhydroxyalkanoate synthesis regulator phasin
VTDLNTKEHLETLFSNADNTAERFWEISLVTLGSLAWNQEQIDNFVRKYLDQKKLARDEGTRLMEEMYSQARQNQQQIQHMIQDSVVGTFGKLDIPAVSYYDEIAQKIDELSKKIANL